MFTVKRFGVVQLFLWILGVNLFLFSVELYGCFQQNCLQRFANGYKSILGIIMFYYRKVLFHIVIIIVIYKLLLNAFFERFSCAI